MQVLSRPCAGTCPAWGPRRCWPKWPVCCPGRPEAIGEIFATLEEALSLLDQGLPPDSLLPAFLLRLLTLGGYGPRLGHCLKCGQEPAPPLYFSIPQGGILCGACRAGSPRPLAAPEPGDLEAAAPGPGDGPGKTLPPPLSPSSGTRAWRSSRPFCCHHLGRGLKSWSFWEKVTTRGEREWGKEWLKLGLLQKLVRLCA